MSKSGLINIRGGKWTTYRKMAQDTIAFVHSKKTLAFTPADTRYTKIVDGPLPDRISLPSEDEALRAAIQKAANQEMCVSVEDFLARRYRTLFLDAKLAISSAPRVAEILAEVHGFPRKWAQKETAHFQKLAQRYLPQTVKQRDRT